MFYWRRIVFYIDFSGKRGLLTIGHAFERSAKLCQRSTWSREENEEIKFQNKINFAPTYRLKFVLPCYRKQTMVFCLRAIQECNDNTVYTNNDSKILFSHQVRVFTLHSFFFHIHLTSLCHGCRTDYATKTFTLSLSNLMLSLGCLCMLCISIFSWYQLLGGECQVLLSQC